MATDMSDRFALPFLSSGQAQKEVTHNEALAIIDMLLHAHAQSVSVATPPGSAVVGECWIVGAGGSEAWSGYDNHLACLTSGGWRFIAPRAGMRVSVFDNGLTYVYDDAAWRIDPVRPDGFYLDGARIIGPRGAAVANPSGGSVVDSEARLALTLLLDILRDHGLIGPA